MAAKKLWALTDCEDKRVKVEVLRDWLNRSMGKPTAKVEMQDNRTESDDFDFKAAIKEIKDNTTPDPLMMVS